MEIMLPGWEWQIILTPKLPYQRANQCLSCHHNLGFSIVGTDVRNSQTRLVWIRVMRPLSHGVVLHASEIQPAHGSALVKSWGEVNSLTEPGQ
jgi:hypothetical protein